MIPLIIILLRYYRGHACFKVDRPNIAQKVVMIAFMELRWKNQNQDSSALGLATFFTSTKRFLVHIHLQYIIKNKKGWDAKLTHRMLGGSTLFLQSPQAAERGETKRKEN